MWIDEDMTWEEKKIKWHWRGGRKKKKEEKKKEYG